MSVLFAGISEFMFEDSLFASLSTLTFGVFPLNLTFTLFGDDCAVGGLSSVIGSPSESKSESLSMIIASSIQ